MGACGGEGGGIWGNDLVVEGWGDVVVCLRLGRGRVGGAWLGRVVLLGTRAHGCRWHTDTSLTRLSAVGRRFVAQGWLGSECDNVSVLVTALWLQRHSAFGHMAVLLMEFEDR